MAASERLADDNRKVFGALSSLAGRLGATGHLEAERVTVAVMELPYALIRRHLREGVPIPEHTAELAEQCARAILPP